MGAGTQGSRAPEARQELTSHIHARVSKAADEILTGAAAARGLARQLDSLAELNAAADAEALRDAAIGVRAIGVQLALGALTLVGVSERLAAYAALRELGDEL